MPKTKTAKGVYADVHVNGRLYHYHSWHEKKSTAQAEAARLRRAGYHAIVRATTSPGPGKYAVYNTYLGG
jgi:tRNA(Ile2) C34 agmatinyltransferase TiaS